MKRILTLLFLLPLFAIGQCDTVTGLTATGVGHASATISFTAPSASLYFVLIYNGTRQNINDPGGPYPALVTAPLNSLTPSTAYTYTIVRYCSGSDSAESSDYYFTTTAPPCDTVTNVAASVTSNSVSITSTAAAYGDSYVIYYVRDGQTDTTTEASADEDFQLANLRPNTLYWYQIGTICGSDTTRNTRRSFTTSNSPAYTPSYNFGWQYKRLAPDSTLNLPTMASPSLRNGKNDKAALVYDTTIGAPAVFNPLTQDWEYLLAGGTGVDTFYWSSDTFYLVTPLQTFTVFPEECPPTFEELEGDPYDNTALAAALNAKENNLPVGNTSFDTTIRYLNGYKTWSYFDSSVLNALGITYDAIGGEPFYYWNRRGNFLINRNNIVNMDSLDLFGGTYRYNGSTTGTKPGTSGGGVIYNYGQNDLNHINEDDRSSQFVIDNNGQIHARTSNAGVWGSWLTPAYSTDLDLYLPLTGGTLNGYLTFVNKTASPSTPAVGTNTFHFDNGGLFRVWTATGNFYRFDTTGMGTSNLTLKLKALEVLSGASGTPSATTYLRGDGTWATPSGSGSGTVNSGTANRLAYYAATGTAVSELTEITANRALISDANGLPTHSSVTNTELGYVSGVTSAIQTQLTGKQASDADLTTIAGLTPTNDDVLQYKSGAWANRTMAQLKTDLALVKGDVGLGNVDNTSDATKNSATVTLTNKTIDLASNTLTGTTAQFNTALSDGNFATIAGAETLTSKTLTSPVINTPTGIVKGDVGLGNVDNTSDANKPVSTAQQTALDLKANLASPTFTGTVSGITSTMVGLGNVDNTSNATERAATATLTNKTIAAGSNTISGLTNSNLSGSAGITVANQSYVAQSIAVNNTGSTAAPTAVGYQEVIGSTYGGTLDWDGTDPTSLTSCTYDWYRIGSSVTVVIRGNYATPGTTNTTLLIPLPTDCPTPRDPGGRTAASTRIYPGSGGMSTSLTTTWTNNNRVWMANNAADNGYVIVVFGASASANSFEATVTYTATSPGP